MTFEVGVAHTFMFDEFRFSAFFHSFSLLSLRSLFYPSRGCHATMMTKHNLRLPNGAIGKIAAPSAVTSASSSS
jgi:hypothetical protein